MKSTAQAAGGETRIRALFRDDWVEAVCQEIERSDVIVGCLYWLSHPTVLHALAKRPVVSIVVQCRRHEPRLLARYATLPVFRPKEWSWASDGTMTPMALPKTVAKEWDAVRQWGENESYATENESKMHTLLHHKFLVFGRTTQKGILTPTSCWTGSTNVTAHAEQNHENSLLIHNPQLAQMYVNEWIQRMTESKPLPRPRSPCASTASTERALVKETTVYAGAVDAQLVWSEQSVHAVCTATRDMSESSTFSLASKASQKSAAKRCLALLTESCSCGATFHSLASS